jgi:hypothetical protein
MLAQRAWPAPPRRGLTPATRQRDTGGYGSSSTTLRSPRQANFPGSHPTCARRHRQPAPIVPAPATHDGQISPDRLPRHKAAATPASHPPAALHQILRAARPPRREGQLEPSRVLRPGDRDCTGPLHHDITEPGPRWMIPGRRPSRARIARGRHAPGRHPGHPGNPSLRPGGIRASRPGSSLIPCAVTRDQLRRQGRRAPYSRHDRRGCQHHGNPEDPVGGRSVHPQ